MELTIKRCFKTDKKQATLNGAKYEKILEIAKNLL